MIVPSFTIRRCEQITRGRKRRKITFMTLTYASCLRFLSSQGLPTHQTAFFQAFDHLDKFFMDCDRKTEAAKKRLTETQEYLSEENKDKAEQVLELNEQIGKTLAEAERLGSEGKVEESLELMKKVDELKKSKNVADVRTFH